MLSLYEFQEFQLCSQQRRRGHDSQVLATQGNKGSRLPQPWPLSAWSRRIWSGTSKQGSLRLWNRKDGIKGACIQSIKPATKFGILYPCSARLLAVPTSPHIFWVLVTCFHSLLAETITSRARTPVPPTSCQVSLCCPEHEKYQLHLCSGLQLSFLCKNKLQKHEKYKATNYKVNTILSNLNAFCLI